MNTHKKNHLPTAYGFACGYCATKTIKIGSKQLYKEHTVYHVRTYEANINSIWPFKNIVWESFEKLNEAWKFFNSIK